MKIGPLPSDIGSLRCGVMETNVNYPDSNTNRWRLSRTSTYELIAAGKLKTVKIGRRRFITIEALDEFIAALSV